MNVELFAMTRAIDGHDNPLWVSENAACECYDSNPSESLKVAKGCAKTGHLSVLEHVNFTFRIEDISRACLAQLTRHRHFSFSVRSQRYCVEDDFNYVNPFPGDTPLSEAVSATCDELGNIYANLRLNGAKPEDARCILPNACCTNLWVTANARALIEASHLRLCSRAQKEIRELFKAMKAAILSYCPEVANLMVPSCEKYPERPFCPEHSSCGRHPKLCDL